MTAPVSGTSHASKQLLAFCALMLVMLLWSGNSIVGRAVRDDMPPFTLALLRWAGALCVVAPFAFRHVMADRQVLRRSWKPVLLLGLTGVACFNALLYSGLRHTTATNAMLLQAAIPALVLVVDFTVFRLMPSRCHLIGVTVSTLGVLVVIAKGALATILGLHFGFGDMLIVGAIVGWSLYTSLLKLRPDCHPLSFVAVTFAIGAVAMVPLAATEWREIVTMRWTPAVFGAWAYVAVLPSVVAYMLYNAAVATVGAARAGQAISLMPVFGALLAAVLLDEDLHGFHLAGMVLILMGIAVSAGGAALTARCRDVR